MKFRVLPLLGIEVETDRKLGALLGIAAEANRKLLLLLCIASVTYLHFMKFGDLC